MPDSQTAVNRELLIVTGRSGSGKSSVLNLLEDAGFYCMDNFPVKLLPSLFSKTAIVSDKPRKFAVSVDVRASEEDIAELPERIRLFAEEGIQCEILFLDADTATLIRRFSETRRKHPLTDKTTDLQAALSRESAILEPLLNIADVTINTSQLAPSMLGDAVAKRFNTDPGAELLVVVQSFGFKRGIPIDADFVFDVRCLPNPFWLPELQGHSGQDSCVIDFLSQHEDVAEMIDSISSFISRWLSAFQRGTRSYLTIGIGCTGGQHRSVYVAERIASRLNEIHFHTMVRHRDLKP